MEHKFPNFLNDFYETMSSHLFLKFYSWCKFLSSKYLVLEGANFLLTFPVITYNYQCCKTKTFSKQKNISCFSISWFTHLLFTLLVKDFHISSKILCRSRCQTFLYVDRHSSSYTFSLPYDLAEYSQILVLCILMLSYSRIRICFWRLWPLNRMRSFKHISIETLIKKKLGYT